MPGPLRLRRHFLAIAPLSREFLEPGGGEVAVGERRAKSFERFGEAAGVEVAVRDDSHSASFMRTAR